MPSIFGWIRFFVGLFIIGSVVIFSEPMFDVLDAHADTQNISDAHPTLVFIQNARKYSMILIGIALIISAFAESTITEGGGYYR